MTAKVLPVPGEPFLGDVPAPMKVLKVSFGVTSSDFDTPDVVVATSAAAAYVLAYVPSGYIIHELVANKKKAFSSTGAFTLNVGYATDDDAILESTGLIASDLGAFGSRHSTALNAVRIIPPSSDIGAASDLDSDSRVGIVATIGAHKVSVGIIDFYLVYSKG